MKRKLFGTSTLWTKQQCINSYSVFMYISCGVCTTEMRQSCEDIERGSYTRADSFTLNGPSSVNTTLLSTHKYSITTNLVPNRPPSTADDHETVRFMFYTLVVAVGRENLSRSMNIFRLLYTKSLMYYTSTCISFSTTHGSDGSQGRCVQFFSCKTEELVEYRQTNTLKCPKCANSMLYSST